MGETFDINWRPFPLEQVNSSEGDNWKFWEQSPDDVKSLRAFMAAEAAKEQGTAKYRDFIFQLLHLIHDEKKPVQSEDTIKEAAQAAGLDWGQLQQAMQNDELRQRIGESYTEAVDQYGVFGTPTYLFPGGDALFVKMSPPSDPDVAVSFFETVRTLCLERPYVQELKKPRKPD